MKIETERLIITGPRVGYLNSIWEHRNDPHATLYTGGINQLRFLEFKEKYFDLCTQFDQNALNTYAVLEKRNKEYIGYCGFQECQILGGVELLYGYLKKYWDKGYGFEAAKAIISYGFETYLNNPLFAAVNPTNIASDKILVKLGFKYTCDIDWPEQGLVKKYTLSPNQYLKSL